MGTVVVGLVLASVVGLIIKSMVSAKKKGKSIHCSGCCGSCNGHCH